MVHVVSMLDVPKRFGSVSFQSNDVSGAQNSLFLFCSTVNAIRELPAAAAVGNVGTTQTVAIYAVHKLCKRLQKTAKDSSVAHMHHVVVSNRLQAA